MATPAVACRRPAARPRRHESDTWHDDVTPPPAAAVCQRPASPPGGARRAGARSAGAWAATAVDQRMMSAENEAVGSSIDSAAGTAQRAAADEARGHSRRPRADAIDAEASHRRPDEAAEARHDTSAPGRPPPAAPAPPPGARWRSTANPNREQTSAAVRPRHRPSLRSRTADGRHHRRGGRRLGSRAQIRQAAPVTAGSRLAVRRSR